MVAVDLFASRKPWVGPLKFDASFLEEHAVDVDVTEYPIESGGLIADHRVVRPRAITMTVGASSLPDELLSLPEPTRHIRMWRRLRDLCIAGLLVDIVTTAEIYPLMHLTHVSAPRSRDTNGHLYYTIRARRIQFALLDGAEQIADAAQDIALGAVDAGAQAARLAGAPELIELGAILGVAATAAEIGILAAISKGEPG